MAPKLSADGKVLAYKSSSGISIKYLDNRQSPFTLERLT